MKHSLALAAFALLCLPAVAHDMWLVPPEGGRVGEPVEVVVSVGMDFPNSLNAIDPARLTTRALGPAGASAEVQVRALEDEKRTTTSFTPTAPGAWMLSTVTRPKQLDMKAAKFNDYLLHDGLPHVLAGRMDRGEWDRDAVERYSKYVKCAVRVGEAMDAGAAQAVLGHTLEIVPLADPFDVSVGQTLAVRVLYEGQPLERANLCWDHPGNGEDFTGQTWTDRNGKALVPIGKSGPMTLRLIHMTRPMKDDYEWESFWASYTFRVEEGGPARSLR